MKRKAQLSYNDFIIGLIIFSVTLMLFYKFSPNLAVKDDTQDLLREGKIISDSLLTEGYPKGWNSSNAVIIGLTDGNYAVNQTKFQRFADIDYDDTRSLFKTKYDYYLFFEDENKGVVEIGGIDGKGYAGVNSSNIELIDAKSLVKITRLVSYDSKPVKMVLLLWQI